MDIDRLINDLIKREGGYVDHPADKGGPTNWGVTEQVARAYGYAGSMKALPRGRAEDIYRKRYWSGPRFDQVGQRYPRLAEELFDTGVNMGPAVAATFLQRALNALNRGAVDYPDIAADGAIGAMTLAALDAYRKARGAAGETVLLRAVDALQGARYIEIAERRAANEAFVYGWLANRVGGA
ncbi:putative peptidoglycan binding protein [Hephaestia caeni]|uniref:Putative peptidoglycan binding protein n=1 Tax=Hephaestia caeni TaxID=645617 RepID=A0A397PD24_9SPHN|nr:glycosyl hydrolase 108 family protein [Hephaestia caeni]RIA44064.1 putative peptidoglycan binding protein [Hephaestia caeni]